VRDRVPFSHFDVEKPPRDGKEFSRDPLRHADRACRTPRARLRSGVPIPSRETRDRGRSEASVPAVTGSTWEWRWCCGSPRVWTTPRR
jgi:hypothetical protein